jgi:hypothetical protein
MKVIREKCSEVLHILDRFQIGAKMNNALDEVRAAETRRMRREGRGPVLKKSKEGPLVACSNAARISAMRSISGYRICSAIT